MMIFGIVAAVILLAVLAMTLYCYRVGFYAPRKEKPITDEIELPEGEIYEVYLMKFLQDVLATQMLSMPILQKQRLS